MKLTEAIRAGIMSMPASEQYHFEYDDNDQLVATSTIGAAYVGKHGDDGLPINFATAYDYFRYMFPQIDDVVNFTDEISPADVDGSSFMIDLPLGDLIMTMENIGYSREEICSYLETKGY